MGGSSYSLWVAVVGSGPDPPLPPPPPRYPQAKKRLSRGHSRHSKARPGVFRDDDPQEEVRGGGAGMGAGIR